MSSLIHCIYASAETSRFDSSELADLLRHARNNNQRLGLTGMLLFSGGSFLQVLEGDADVVDAMYERIALDTRHGQVTLIIREPIAKRSFNDWSMGFFEIAHDDLAQMEGFQAVTSVSFAQLDSGRARKLLNAFAEGRWRKLGNKSAARG